MKMKSAFTTVLLLFVAFSLIYLLTSQAPPPAVSEGESPAPATRADSTNPALEAAPPAPKEGRWIVAYYFHTTQRCITCRMIEEFTREALEEGFPEAVAEGSLVWRPVNVQMPDNQHFIQDYQLTSKSVVLVEMAGEEELRWKNLDKIWLLVHDKSSFLSYVHEETRDFLGE